MDAIPSHNLLDVFLCIDLQTRKQLLAAIGVNGALALRASCRQGLNFVDPLFSANVHLGALGLIENDPKWDSSVSGVLVALSHWPACSHLQLSAFADARSRNLNFAFKPLEAASMKSFILPHIRSLALNVDVVQRRNLNRVPASGQDEWSQDQQQLPQHQKSPDVQPQRRVVIVGCNSEKGSPASGTTAPTSTPERTQFFVQPFSSGGFVTRRDALPPLDLPSDLTTAIAHLFPSLERLALIGHWANAHRALPIGPCNYPASTTNITSNSSGGPLAALASLRSLSQLDLPVTLCGDEDAVEVSGLARLGPSVRHLTVRTDATSHALRQRTRLSWPIALLAALPHLQSLTLVGGYSRAADLLLPGARTPAGGNAATIPMPPPSLSPSLSALPSHQHDHLERQHDQQPRPPPPRRQVVRLRLEGHLAFLPEPLQVQALEADLAAGRLELRAPLNVARLGAVVGVFEGVAEAARAAAEAAAGPEAAAAEATPEGGASATLGSVETCREPESESGGRGISEPPPPSLLQCVDEAGAAGSGSLLAGSGPGCGSRPAVSPVRLSSLRRVVVGCLLLNRCPREADWAVLEAFAARPGCSFEVQELSVTYPECGVGGGPVGRGDPSADEGGDAVLEEEGGPGPGPAARNAARDGGRSGGGSRPSSHLQRALDLSAVPCRRIWLRVPAGDAGVVAAAVGELAEVRAEQLPGEVVVEALGGAWESVGGEGAADGGVTATEASVAAALQRHPHLQGCGRMVIRCGC